MNNAEKNVVKYYSDQILEYRVQINQPKDFCQFANLIKLNSESVDKLKKDFPCDDDALFLAIQTQDMRTHSYKGMPWNIDMLAETPDISKKILHTVNSKDFVNLVKFGMGKIFDDMLLSKIECSSFAIYARKEGYIEIAGIVTGIKEDANSPINFVYAVNPEWELGKKLEKQEQMQM